MAFYLNNTLIIDRKNEKAFEVVVNKFPIYFLDNCFLYIDADQTFNFPYIRSIKSRIPNMTQYSTVSFLKTKICEYLAIDCNMVEERLELIKNSIILSVDNIEKGEQDLILQLLIEMGLDIVVFKYKSFVKVYEFFKISDEKEKITVNDYPITFFSLMDFEVYYDSL